MWLLPIKFDPTALHHTCLVLACFFFGWGARAQSPMACRILLHLPGIELRPTAVKMPEPDTRLPGNSSPGLLLNPICDPLFALH